ncbi:unnamed protein product [Musa hybrid cultivar]
MDGSIWADTHLNRQRFIRGEMDRYVIPRRRIVYPGSGHVYEDGIRYLNSCLDYNPETAFRFLCDTRGSPILFVGFISSSPPCPNPKEKGHNRLSSTSHPRPPDTLRQKIRRPRPRPADTATVYLLPLPVFPSFTVSGRPRFLGTSDPPPFRITSPFGLSPASFQIEGRFRWKMVGGGIQSSCCRKESAS